MTSDDGDDTSRPDLLEIHKALLVAVEHGRVDVITQTLNKFPEYKSTIGTIKLPLELDITPLFKAVTCQKVDVVRVLLSINASNSASISTPSTTNPYAYAVEHQMEKVTQVFHEFLIQQIAMDDAGRVTALLEDFNIKKLSSINDGTPLRNTPIHWAASCDAQTVLPILLTKDPEGVNVTNSRNATALHEAIKHQNVECMKLLLEANVANVSSSFDQSAIDAANSSSSTNVRDCMNEFLSTDRGQKKVVEVSNNSSISNSSLSELDSSMLMVPAIARLKGQLEEKNTLVAELQQTIEELVLTQQITERSNTNSSEEGSCVLEYIRKLKAERLKVSNAFDLAQDHIQHQQVLLNAAQREIELQKEKIASQELEIESYKKAEIIETKTAAMAVDIEEEEDRSDDTKEEEVPGFWASVWSWIPTTWSSSSDELEENSYEDQYEEADDEIRVITV